MRQPNDFTGYIPNSFAATTLDMLNPNRSVIIDMIMVQLISVIVVMSMILIFKGGSMSSASVSYYLRSIRQFSHAHWCLFPYHSLTAIYE